jgi:hypothetical protein
MPSSACKAPPGSANGERIQGAGLSAHLTQWALRRQQNADQFQLLPLILALPVLYNCTIYL